LVSVFPFYSPLYVAVCIWMRKLFEPKY